MVSQTTSLQSPLKTRGMLIAVLVLIVQGTVGFSAYEVNAAPGRGGTQPILERGKITRTPAGSIIEKWSTGYIPPQTIRDGAKNWERVFHDDFESGFPGSTWEIYNQSTVVEAYWDDWTCWSGTSSSHSVGCAVGGVDAINCGNEYPAFMESWMIHGPISLAGQGFTNAKLEFNLNLNSEEGYDDLFVGVSVDEVNYNGIFYSGSMNEAMVVDMNDLGVPENVCESSQVSIAFIFFSDDVFSASNGAQIDDVAVWGEAPIANVAPEVTLTSPNGGESFAPGQSTTITFDANDPDDGPSALTVNLFLSTDNGTSWNPIVENLANTGSYPWTVPNVETNSARISVVVNDGEDLVTDSSDNGFTITSVTNVLYFNQAGGSGGSTVVVPFSLVNDQGVKGVQLDVQYDASVATFVGVTAEQRAAGMSAAGSQVGQGLGRIIMYFDDAAILEPGDGLIGHAIFTVQGAGSEQSSLTPVNMILSGPDSESLPVSGVAGSVFVEAPTGVPVLQISALKNPGRTRSFQLFVRVAGGSGNPPNLTAGGTEVELTPLNGSLFLGSYSVGSSVSNLIINATDTNINGDGTSQVTVSFP